MMEKKNRLNDGRVATSIRPRPLRGQTNSSSTDGI